MIIRVDNIVAAMELCIIPIELIDAICREDLGTWSSLIRTCKRIHSALIDYRWAAKVAVRRVEIIKSEYGSSFVKLCRGNYTREVRFNVFDDYWKITAIHNYIDDKEDGETVYVSGNGIHSIYWYRLGTRIGHYSANCFCCCPYHIDNNKGNVLSTEREIIKTELDKLGVKYVWFNYLPGKI